jgi:D-galactarolactone cycloisomerase
VKIRDVECVWLRCPLPEGKQHVSDFGRIRTFDAVLVTVTTDDGVRGYGEAKPSVGSAGDGSALCAIVRNELRPALLGADPRDVGRHHLRMTNGVRAPLAERFGRAMPILGRRGAHAAAIAGVDLALWDLAAKLRGLSVLELLGGACRDRVAAYASGGWAPADAIGAELSGYVAAGFRAVKMRVGAMDGSVERSLARVRAAREALGPDVALMVDAHGTMNVAEARRFAAAAAPLHLAFVEEPVLSEDRAGLAAVRAQSPLAIAAGESESGCADFAELIAAGALDVLQPDLAIAGGMSEGLRIGALAYAHRLALAPHCWGSAISFQAGRTLAFACPAGTYVEVPMGGAPLLREMAKIDLAMHDGALLPPTGLGFGVEPDPDFVRRHAHAG